MSARRQSPRAEAKALEDDLAAQELGSSRVLPPRLARSYVQAVHPETGLAVVFVPGEALPPWAKEGAGT